MIDDSAMQVERNCRRYLLKIARKFAKANHLSLGTVSKRVHGAAHFLEEFERGNISITLRKYDQMLKSFYRQWPVGVKFPSSKGTINGLENSLD